MLRLFASESKGWKRRAALCESTPAPVGERVICLAEIVYGLPEFQGDRVARQQSVEKCFAHLLRGTTVALRGLVERLEQLFPALLKRLK